MLSVLVLIFSWIFLPIFLTIALVFALIFGFFASLFGFFWLVAKGVFLLLILFMLLKIGAYIFEKSN